METHAERVTLVYRIRIDIDNPTHELVPGMPADAAIDAADGHERGGSAQIEVGGLTKRFAGVVAVEDLELHGRRRARSSVSSAPTAPARPR